MLPLVREEYVEQAYLFRGLNHRTDASDPIQIVLKHLRDEILSTTKLPLAIDYLLTELRHVGTMSTAMGRLSHYFSPFQTFVIAAAEDDRGRFDMRMAFRILESEAKFRSESNDPIGLFFYQFETICRNQLDYDYGLQAIAGDSAYDDAWRKWILSIRHQIGMVSLADLVYVYSQFYQIKQSQQPPAQEESTRQPGIILFGEKEGRIALANRNKEPLYFFSALQRQLSYPVVPSPKRKNPAEELLPKLVKQLERMEMRLKFMEDEQRESGIDLSKFYGKSESSDGPRA